jgi:hypothetical protein
MSEQLDVFMLTRYHPKISPPMSSKSHYNCNVCDAPLYNFERILIWNHGQITEQIPVCNKHQESMARVLKDTGKVREVFVPIGEEPSEQKPLFDS